MSSDYITRIKTFDGEKQIDYNSLANLPDIPQGTSELTNDAGFLTHIPFPTNTTLGGLKAQPRGHEDNAEVKVGTDGKLYVNVLSKELDIQSKRLDAVLALQEGSTTGDAELIDIRLGYDGTEYRSAGEAVRNQVKGVPNYGVIVGNYIKFYRSSGSDEPDFFLFEVDVTQLLESGLSLENLSLSAENENNSIILSMDDGKIEKVIELPIMVDSVLSLSSINPVQNRVVTEQLNYVIEEIDNIKENGIGGGGGSKKHYKWDGSAWILVSTLPYTFTDGYAVVYNNEIHILGNYTYSYRKSHFKLNTDHPKATLTFLAKNLLKDSVKMNTSSSNVGGWTSSQLRSWLNTELLTMLSSELQSAVIEVTKLSDGGYSDNTIKSTNDKIWIPSVDEIGLSPKYALAGQGTCYSCFTDNNSRIKTKVNSSTAGSWWTRSCTMNSDGTFYSVYTWGSETAYTANANCGVLIGFCI